MPVLILFHKQKKRVELHSLQQSMSVAKGVGARNESQLTVVHVKNVIKCDTRQVYVSTATALNFVPVGTYLLSLLRTIFRCLGTRKIFVELQAW